MYDVSISCIQSLQSIRFAMQKGSKEYESLKRQVHSLLRDFEKNKEWADFSNWLHRLHEQLNRKSKHSDLPYAVTLAKRLAQCLNPVLPAGVHTTALKVYEVILNNFGNKVEILPLLSMGLFPFFEHSASANRLILLRMFDEHFVKETEVVQMVVGLTNALLTGLNQNNEDLARKIYAISDKVSRNYGRLWMDGAVWVNILKSPKVRLAGFKYFMKVFKDRDRAVHNGAEEDPAEVDKVNCAIKEKIEGSLLKEEEMIFLTKLYEYSYLPDEHGTRFPNFNTLIVNTLCICLQNSAQNMLKRSALDLLINYLRLQKHMFGRKEGVLLVRQMLLLLQGKEYNLTSRVYKYLFGQPNSEGVFVVDGKVKEYELQVLRQALETLLEEGSQGSFLIIQLLLDDHPALTSFILKNLSYFILKSMKNRVSAKQKMPPANVIDFHLNIITKHRITIIESVIAKVTDLKEPSKENSKMFDQILEVLKFYFNRLEALTPLKRRKGSGVGEDFVAGDNRPDLEEYLYIRGLTLREVLTFLSLQPKIDEVRAHSCLDLCNSLYGECSMASPEGRDEVMTVATVEIVEQMLQKEALDSRKSVYSRLVTLLPHPKKEMLLPYIEDISLAVVCIGILLGQRPRVESSLRKKMSIKSSRGDSFIGGECMPVTQQEQAQLFKAIFKLLNCHLFEVKALEFIERFRRAYSDTFCTLIDQVEPSEWLVYWRRLEGGVAGGIIRMIESAQSRDSYHQHLSRKWLHESEPIISKVLDPIFALMDASLARKTSAQEEQAQNGHIAEWTTANHETIFRLLRVVFRCTSRNFGKYFYIQKEKYLHTLVLFIFKCMQKGEFPIRSRSLAMLSFLLEQTVQLSEKDDVVRLTLPNTAEFLSRAVDEKRSIEQNMSPEEDPDTLLNARNLQIELLEYVGRIVASLSQLAKQTQRQGQLLKMLKECRVYDVVLRGMCVTGTPYIRTLYLDCCREMAEMLALLDPSKQQLAGFTSKVLEKLFGMLKNSDMGMIEEMVKGRREFEGPRRKRSLVADERQEMLDSVFEEPIRAALHLQQKYSEIIELWNSIKFYIQFSVRAQLPSIPIHDLLSIILHNFPLSQLAYTPVGSHTHQVNLEMLEEEINNVTGLKKEVLEIFEILWAKESKQILEVLIEKGDPRILIHARLDPGKVLETFNRNGKLKEAVHYIRSRFSLPKNTLHFHLQTLNKQNQLFYFVYLYLLYCNMRLIKNRRTALFFDALQQLLTSFKISPHVQTKLWMLELLQLIAHRMLSTKDVHFDGWSKTKSDLQNTTKELFEEIVEVVAGRKCFTHRTEIKTGLFNLFSKEEKETSLYDFVKIFPPTISQAEQQYQQRCKRADENKLELFKRKSSQKEENVDSQQPRSRLVAYIMEEDSNVLEKERKADQILFGRHSNLSGEDFASYLSLCGLKTLIRFAMSLLMVLNDKDLARVCVIIKESLMVMLPLCERREEENQIFNELVAEFLHTVLEQEQTRSELIRLMRKHILESFQANGFFKCTQRTLAHWRAVIDYCTQGYDLLGELLQKEGLFEGIFAKRAEMTRMKIKSFERVCFVVYSGRVDKYQRKMRTVLESLNDVMKKENPEPALLILILFCIRILLMRLSSISLNKLFRSVWPSLITLLVQVFKRDQSGTRHNLQLAALKVLELLHALQLEEFMFHRWIFIFDYFGLKIEPMGDIEDNMAQCEMLSPFCFKPYLTSVLPNSRLKCRFAPQAQGRHSVVGQGVTRRRLIVKQTTVGSEEELKETGVLLMQYMMDLNEARCEVARSDIQNLIEEDFISLDDYIFKVK